VQGFPRGILDASDYRQAWQLADANWRLCRAQAWIWNNRDHPLVAGFDREAAAIGLAADPSDYALWNAFASTELDQFTEAWSEPDLRAYGAASRPRRVSDGEIVMLVDLSEYPGGAMVHEATPVTGVPFFVRKVAGNWVIANVAGDHLPKPGWPPDWMEGWTYWDTYLD
jgi:hypothetical protein